MKEENHFLQGIGEGLGMAFILLPILIFLLGSL